MSDRAWNDSHPIANAVFECRSCGLSVNTDGNAAWYSSIHDGVRFVGVRCNCGVSYTVEIVEAPPE